MPKPVLPPRGAATEPGPELAVARKARSSVPPLDPVRYAPTSHRPVRAKVRQLGADTQVQPHAHPWAQLALSSDGVIRMTAGRSTYLVPPSRALWIPPGVSHAVTVVQPAEIRTLYIHQDLQLRGPGVAAGEELVWQSCRVLEVSSLLRELVRHLPDDADGPTPQQPSERERSLGALVLDELRRARAVKLGIDLPNDKRLRLLCEAVLDNPARWSTLEQCASMAGASPRTVARLFRSELGTSFVQWRQQVLLARALALAARKRPMALIASELGYASASAFTAMVTRSVGMPPSRFFT